MRLLFAVLLIAVSLSVQAQSSVTGSWYGLANAAGKGPNANNYLTELIIRQKGNEVEGIFGYYFRTGYQSYYIRGSFNPKTRKLTIKNLPVTYYKSKDIDGIDCPMDFTATLLTSRAKSTLTGSFVSQSKYQYTCPELSFTYTLDTDDKSHDSLMANSSMNVKKYWQPRGEELVVNTRDISPVAVATTAPPAIELRKDSTQEEKALAETKKEMARLSADFGMRKTVKSSEILIESDSVRLSFYDNGDIDGDSITVFVNKVPVLTHQLLSEKALNMYLAVDSAHPITEVAMYAENLGTFPPNTALMVITDGSKRHEVYLSSSLSQNSSVILKKRPPGIR